MAVSQVIVRMLESENDDDVELAAAIIPGLTPDDLIELCAYFQTQRADGKRKYIEDIDLFNVNKPFVQVRIQVEKWCSERAMQ